LKKLSTHRLFAINLDSDFPFDNYLAPSKGPTELTFTVSDQPPISEAWDSVNPVYRSPRQDQHGESIAHLHRLSGYEVLSFPRVADFYVQSERIACHLRDPDLEYMVEIRLLGPVLSYWLERRGIPALHASAVAVDGQAIAFISRHGGGKTGLAAAMMQAGYPLLTDDILPVEDKEGLQGRPGYPQVRMWPDEAAYFVGRFEELPLVHPELSKRRVPVGPGGFGSFYDSPLPLKSIFLAERSDLVERVEIRPVSSMEAVIELVRHSFLPRLVEAAGLQPARLDLFARLVKQVPVRRLVYPSGFEHLPRVVDAILGALRNHPGIASEMGL